MYSLLLIHAIRALPVNNIIVNQNQLDGAETRTRQYFVAYHS